MFMLIKTQFCDIFNKSFSTLVLPSHLRDSEYVTDRFFLSIDHPSNGWSVIYISNDLFINVHEECNPAVLNSILSVFVSDNAITQAECDEIITKISTNLGSSIKAADLIPTSWLDNIITEEQMMNDGWLPDINTITGT